MAEVAHVLLLVLGGILILVGFVGTVLPVLPGAPIAWLGLLVERLACGLPATWLLVLCAVLAVLVSVADNIFPSLMTRRSGGSKAGTWGSTIGLIVGMFLGPLGIILGPFGGAFIGEMIHDSSDMRRAFRAALGAFKGFLAGTGMKMLCVAVMAWIYVWILLR